MKRGNVRGRIGVWACFCVVFAASPSHGNEIWVAPTYQADAGGLGSANGVWPVTAIGASRLVLAVPDDLQTFQAARIALIRNAPAGAAMMHLYVCSAQNSTMVGASCSPLFSLPFTSVVNQLIEVDVSAALAAHVTDPGNRYIAVAAYTTPTTKTDHIVGMRFVFGGTTVAGPQGVPGPQGPPGPQGSPGLLASFDALAGLPCTSASGQASVVRFEGPLKSPICPEPSGSLTLSVTSLNFGFVACGAQAGVQTFTVTNNYSQTLTLTLTLGGGDASPYFVSGPASLDMGATGTVTVTPKAIPGIASIAPDGFGDSLSVNASGAALNETHEVALHETAQGAILSFNPNSLTFTTSGTKVFTVNNVGNLSAPFTLTLGGSTRFSINPTSGTAAAAGGSVGVNATFDRPLFGGPHSANVQVGTTAARCAPLPANLTLNGN
jgi:hypothetical protein